MKTVYRSGKVEIVEMPAYVAAAREEGRITTQMVGLYGDIETPQYFTGGLADAFRAGVRSERKKMAARVARVKRKGW